MTIGWRRVCYILALKKLKGLILSNDKYSSFGKDLSKGQILWYSEYSWPLAGDRRQFDPAVDRRL